MYPGTDAYSHLPVPQHEASSTARLRTGFPDHGIPSPAYSTAMPVAMSRRSK
jgi:hypothetical protein